jgi:purine-nucleoside phosphorylase
VSAAGEAARRFRGQAGIIFGSGLAVVPAGAKVVERLGYADLGWPASAVPGHENALLLATMGGRRLLLACGRPHLYEGYSRAELSAAVVSLAAWGVRRVILTNAAGGLAAAAAPGTAIVVHEVVDLQQAPAFAPEILPVCGVRRAGVVCAALAAHLPARTGRYVAVPGPQYETPSEAAWLATFGDAVGMSTAPEVRAAGALGLEMVVLALVVNRAAAVADHEQVLSGHSMFAQGLIRGLPAVLAAAWPRTFAADVE